MISFARTLIVLVIANAVQASLYATFPIQGSTCAVGQPCQIQWKDDSKTPSTSTMGETTIDLVTGTASNLQTAQNLGGVSNPNTATALTFTPNNGLSPTQQYAIRFIAKSNPSNPIFSTYFTITGGSGTAKPITAAPASSSSASSSPAPIIGSKAPNASANRAATNDSSSSTTSANSSSAASDNASKSAASSVQAPFLAMVVMISLSALSRVL